MRACACRGAWQTAKQTHTFLATAANYAAAQALPAQSPTQIQSRSQSQSQSQAKVKAINMPQSMLQFCSASTFRRGASAGGATSLANGVNFIVIKCALN